MTASPLCEVCGRVYRPTYSGPRTCGVRCGAMLRWGGAGHTRLRRYCPGCGVFGVRRQADGQERCDACGKRIRDGARVPV